MTARRRSTIADVAALAGTSTAVVSYVINHGPRTVAPATRERVEDAIAHLGYRRNALAGALSAGRADVIGVLVPDSSNPFFSELARCIEQVARERGLLTLLGNTGYRPDAERAYLQAFSDLRPQGILVATIAESAAPAVDCPSAYVYSAPDEATRPSVTVDDEDAAGDAVRHLIGEGAREIHCVSGPDGFGPAGLRERGWAGAMREAGLPIASRLHRAPFDRLEARPLLAALLSRPERPDAVFATTDEHALALLDAAADLGLRIPDQLRVIGFDGTREALHGRTRLTTVSVPLPELAGAALDALADGAASRTVVHARLLVGDTCGPHDDAPITPGG